MRKMLLVMTLASIVPTISLAETDLFQAKPKFKPEMIKPDVEVTPYNKNPIKEYKDLEVITPDRPAPVRIPDVVSEGIICTDKGINLRVLFDGPVSKNYSGLVRYPGMRVLPYPPKPWQEGADPVSWFPSRDGKALHAALNKNMMDYLKQGVSQDYDKIGGINYSINMDGKVVERWLSLKGMLLPNC